MAEKKLKKRAIVLSGGGARGAYQVGVISAISHLFQQEKIDPNIDIYTGVSAGAINAGFLAAYCDNFHEAAKRLVDLWSHIHSNQVFFTDAVHLGKIGLKWMGELSFGGLTGTTPGRALLDTSPLHELISKNLDFSRIERNILNKKLEALAITAMDYENSDAITFVQGRADKKLWQKSRRSAEATKITPDHIMASSAIPLLFPPVKIEPRYFGDGCVRNSHPCGPSIYLGADHLIIIGVRNQTGSTSNPSAHSQPPSVARVLNVLLNSVLLDGIELDVERLKRVNDLVHSLPKENHSQITYKPLEYAWIAPSVDIGEIAFTKSSQLPRIIRYLLKGLGTIEEASEIVSYLLFEPAFCSELIEIGFEDGLKQKDEILKIIS